MFNHFSSVRIFLCCSIVMLTAIISNAEAKVESKPKAKSKKSAIGQTIELSPVIVTATRLSDSGAVDGYKAGESRSSTRTNTALIDVPQSISVVTQDQIQDQKISNMGDAVRYVPGVTLHQGENNRDQFRKARRGTG